MTLLIANKQPLTLPNFCLSLHKQASEPPVERGSAKDQLLRKYERGDANEGEVVLIASSCDNK